MAYPIYESFTEDHCAQSQSREIESTAPNRRCAESQLLLMIVMYNKVLKNVA